MSLRRRAGQLRDRLLGPARSAPGTQPAPSAAASIDAQVPLEGEGAVDVRALLEQYTVEELAAAADDYYRKNLDGVDYYFAKPFASIDEAPDFLISFAQVLAGVRPLPGMRVLDFGAGTGWTSRYLTQLGCEVVACDVSSTALEVARALFERLPVAGAQPEPTFLPFDGHRIDLADESMDRVVCIDALHHVPNPREVLAEIGRVLRDGGIAGFQEPGPNHSKKPQSQYEMKSFTVIENDILMRDIWGWARDAGFTQLELAVFTAEPFFVSVAGYEDFLAHGPTADAHYTHLRRFVEDRRIFFLGKGDTKQADSRDRRGLAAEITAALDEPRLPVAAGGRVRGRATVTNTGESRWLPSSAPRGPVLLGAHLYDAQDRLLDRDFARVSLPPGAGFGVVPGERIEVPFDLASPEVPGRYTLELDLVSEGVAWFEMNGSRPARLILDVR